MSVTNLTSTFSEAGSSSTNYQRDETYEGKIAKKKMGIGKLQKKGKRKKKREERETVLGALYCCSSKRETSASVSSLRAILYGIPNDSFV